MLHIVGQFDVVSSYGPNKKFRKSFLSPPRPSEALRPNAGHGLLILEVSWPHTTTHQSVGLLWTSDQLVAETSTWKHTTLNNRQTCPRRDSNPRSQQASGRRSTPYRLRLHWSQKRHNTTVRTDSRQGSINQKHYCLCQRLHWNR